ncbi:hypothetical protein ACHAXN_012998 [Cyclotella atomus]
MTSPCRKMTKLNANDFTSSRKSASIGVQLTVLGIPWEQRYQELRAFKDERGHCNVPQQYEANQQLGQWVQYQRAKLKKYKGTEPLPSDDKTEREQFDKLNGIGFNSRVERKYSSEDEEEARNAKNAALEEKRQWEDMRREAQMKKMKAQEHIYPSGYMIPSGYMMH